MIFKSEFLIKEDPRSDIHVLDNRSHLPPNKSNFLYLFIPQFLMFFFSNPFIFNNFSRFYLRARVTDDSRSRPCSSGRRRKTEEAEEVPVLGPIGVHGPRIYSWVPVRDPFGRFASFCLAGADPQ